MHTIQKLSMKPVVEYTLAILQNWLSRTARQVFLPRRSIFHTTSFYVTGGKRDNS